MHHNRPNQGSSPGGLLLETVRDDPRYSEHADIKLVDSTLGSLGEVLDSVLNPLNNRRMGAAYAKYLSCKEEDLVTSTKAYPNYKGPLIRYTLLHMEPFKFEELSIPGGEDDIRVDGGRRNLEVIQVGPQKTVKVPIRFNYGVTDSRGRKFCFSTNSEEYGSFSITFCYDGTPVGEEAIDEFVSTLESQADKMNFYRGGRISPRGEFLDIATKTWDDIELPEETKKLIKNHIIDMVAKEEIYEKNGISSKRGLLFVGRPGTGKTLVCKILASELKEFTFLWVTSNDLRSPQDVEAIYQMARDLAPTIVLLEDADLFCMTRDFGSGQHILGEILSQLDGLVELKKVVTIMTSNQPGVLDKALIQRPGRFDVQVVFNPPDLEGRINLLSKALSRVRFKKDDLEQIAVAAKDFTGAQLRELANLAIIYAIDDGSLGEDNTAIVNGPHLTRALDSCLRAKEFSGKNYLEDTEASQEELNTTPGSEPKPAPSIQETVISSEVNPDERLRSTKPPGRDQRRKEPLPENGPLCEISEPGSPGVTVVAGGNQPKKSLVLDAVSKYLKRPPGRANL